MHSRETFDAVVGLCNKGFNDCQVSRLTGIPQTTVHRMRTHGRVQKTSAEKCPLCGSGEFSEQQYAYLLGLYLGDGCLVECPHEVFRLEIALDALYPNVVKECIGAIEDSISGLGSPSVRDRPGCVIVYKSWKHWTCVFPQHGTGPKWKRDISLRDWQEKIVRDHPGKLLRGLIHSDGSRDLNRVKGKPYPRYQFKNNSAHIQEIFTTACERVGVHWNRTYWSTISIARRPSVAILDALVGPKA